MCTGSQKFGRITTRSTIVIGIRIIIEIIAAHDASKNNELLSILWHWTLSVENVSGGLSKIDNCDDL